MLNDTVLGYIEKIETALKDFATLNYQYKINAINGKGSVEGIYYSFFFNIKVIEDDYIFGKIVSYNNKYYSFNEFLNEIITTQNYDIRSRTYDKYKEYNNELILRLKEIEKIELDKVIPQAKKEINKTFKI